MPLRTPSHTSETTLAVSPDSLLLPEGDTVARDRPRRGRIEIDLHNIPRNITGPPVTV
jgi:hypothetical protein